MVKTRIALTLVASFLFTGMSMGGNIFSEMGVSQPKIKVKAPAFALKNINGNTERLESYRGKTVMLTFWTTWCNYCKKELPELEKLWRTYKHKNLAIITVALDKNNLAGIKAFRDKYNLSFPILIDTTEKMKFTYEVSAFPTTYFIDKNGLIFGKALGARKWTSETGQHLMESLGL